MATRAGSQTHGSILPDASALTPEQLLELKLLKDRGLGDQEAFRVLSTQGLTPKASDPLDTPVLQQQAPVTQQPSIFNSQNQGGSPYEIPTIQSIAPHSNGAAHQNYIAQPVKDANYSEMYARENLQGINASTNAFEPKSAGTTKGSILDWGMGEVGADGTRSGGWFDVGKIGMDLYTGISGVMNANDTRDRLDAQAADQRGINVLNTQMTVDNMNRDNRRQKLLGMQQDGSTLSQARAHVESDDWKKKNQYTNPLK